MTICKKLELLLRNKVQKTYSSSELKSLMNETYGTNISSVLPADYCYNRTNYGIDKGQKMTNKFLLFPDENNNNYRYVGYNYPYTGLVYHKARKLDRVRIVGYWEEGVYFHGTLDPLGDIESCKKDYESLGKTEREAIVKSRIGQGQFRNELIELWNGCCAVTGLSNLKLLRASHIKPWRDSSNAERLDPMNGLLLQPTLDHLFDSGFITFEESGDIRISKQLSQEAQKVLHLTPNSKLRSNLNTEQKVYLDYHRKHVFKCN